MKELNGTDCPVCKGSTARIYLDETDAELKASTIGSSRSQISAGRILRCQACGFGYRQLRSSPEKLLGLYRAMDSTVYNSELPGRDRTARSHLRIVQKHRLRGRMLDVGCASGLFLWHASRAGWSVTGIEPNERLCEEARVKLEGGDVLCTTLELAELKGGFDVVTAWDVLEHVPDPLAFVMVCRTLLNVDGYLFVNVPDLESWEARLLGRRWPLLLPEHLNYFNRRTLRLCAERSGFSLVQFGRRMAWFSLRYVAFRTAQHGIRGGKWLLGKAQGMVGDMQIPVSLGETFAVFKAT